MKEMDKRTRVPQGKWTAVWIAEMCTAVLCLSYLFYCMESGKTHSIILMGLCALLFSVSVGMSIWQIQAKRIGKSEMERESLLLAMSTVYPLQVLVNLSDDLYEYLPNAKFIVRVVPRSGVYSQLISEGIERVMPEDRSAYENMLSRDYLLHAFSQGNTAIRVEYRDKSEDGEYHWIVMHAYMLNNKVDKKIRAIFFGRENDEEKRTQALIRESLELKNRELSSVYEETEQQLLRQKYYSEIADRTTPGVTLMLSCDTQRLRIVYMRGDTAGLFGYTKEELILWESRLYAGLIFEEDYARIQQMEATLLANRPEKIQIEFRIYRKDGGVIWLMMNGSLSKDYFSNDAYMCMMIDITAQKERESEALIQSNIDHLTGVLNRNAFLENTAEVFKNTGIDQKHGFIMLDIDNFKKINDCCGHSMGDTALKSAVSVLRKTLRADDLIGRLGGDEFIIMLKNISDEHILKQKCEQICSCVSAESPEGMQLSVSLGAAVYPTDARSFEMIYLCVDAAMYEAKRRGKNGYYLYSPDLQSMVLL